MFPSAPKSMTVARVCRPVDNGICTWTRERLMGKTELEIELTTTSPAGYKLCPLTDRWPENAPSGRSTGTTVVPCVSAAPPARVGSSPPALAPARFWEPGSDGRGRKSHWVEPDCWKGSAFTGPNRVPVPEFGCKDWSVLMNPSSVVGRSWDTSSSLI